MEGTMNSPEEHQGLMARLGNLLWGPSGPPKNLDGNALADDRNRIAFQRNLMSWIRTWVSL